MSKENLERFMTQVADSEDLQAKIGEEITGDALVALGAAHGCEFSIEDLQAGAELSDEELERVAGGAFNVQGDSIVLPAGGGSSKSSHKIRLLGRNAEEQGGTLRFGLLPPSDPRIL